MASKKVRATYYVPNTPSHTHLQAKDVLKSVTTSTSPQGTRMELLQHQLLIKDLFEKGLINLHAHLIECDGSKPAESYAGHWFPYTVLRAPNTCLSEELHLFVFFLFYT